MRSVVAAVLGALILSAPMSHPSVAAGGAVFDCNFPEGNSWRLDGGAFKPEPAGTLAFRIGLADPGAATARLLAAGGNAGELKVVEAIGARHFLEVAVEGYLNITTIYDAAEGQPRPAVHSRHLSVAGMPLVSQFRGSCTLQR